ncbi:hypothetical protein QR680_016368 [Steinernema hermaphroditum]|uniref:Uncharacterized protein n=1 Tax=Steinernema hermaphroditum TaxID=289476 RepID=A0AA39LM86_9BILA|nr:hypothetical protein QR680_016368 [Steinernema hermaphroditum]
MDDNASSFLSEGTYIHLLSFIGYCTIGVGLLSTFIILAKTPQAMLPYRFHFLNIYFWTILTTLNLCFFYKYNTIIDDVCFEFLPPFNQFGAHFGHILRCLLQATIINQTLALLFSFILRYLQIIDHGYAKFCASRKCLVFCFLINMVMLLSYTVIAVKFTYFPARLYELTHMTIRFGGRSVLCYPWDMMPFIGILSRVVFGFLAACCAIIVVLFVLMILRLRRLASLMTKQSFETQKIPTIALCALFIVPILFGVVPYVIDELVQTDDDSESRILSLVICLHASVKCIVTVAVVKPYRRCISNLFLTLIGRKDPKKIFVTNTQSIVF